MTSSIKTYALVVIGGGINGVGVAQAAEGHSVLVIERLQKILFQNSLGCFQKGREKRTHRILSSHKPLFLSRFIAIVIFNI